MPGNDRWGLFGSWQVSGEHMMEGRINIDGINLAYTLSGRGPSVVLLHGWMCNRKFWKQQAEVLSQTYQVLALDFRGHGDSDVAERGYTIEQLADDVRAVMEGLGINRAVMAGHSMGGMVAQQFCISHTGFSSGLILVTTIAADLEERLISKQIEKDSTRLGFRQAFLRYFEGWFGPSTDPKVIEWVRKEMLQTSENVGLSLVSSYRRFDLRAHLRDLHIPTLVIGTASDTSAVPVESKTLVALIPEAQLVMIDRAGHFPMLETPEMLNEALEKFLRCLRHTDTEDAEK
jgi:pimeloyl-ACP methyl ester carboxylesterase